jgi:hypothetical protein
MNTFKKSNLKFRLYSWLGRWFYRFRMWLEEWQFRIDGQASRHDPEED